MIRFELLGEIGLKLADGTPVDALLRQPKRLALLAYLVSPVPGAWHRRDTLLALFWPDLDQSRARTSLRNALYVLRQTLGEDVVLTRGDDEVSVDAHRLATDLAALSAALREGRADDAMRLYRGDLLPGLFPSDSEGFERWLETERAQLRRTVARAAVEYAARLQRDGHFPPALETAEWVRRILPHDEPAVRQLMSLHEAMGDRGGALRVFEEYRVRLAADLDAEPAPETVDVAKRLRMQAAIADGATTRARRRVDPREDRVEVARATAPQGATAKKVRGRGPLWILALVVAAVIYWQSVPSAPPPVPQLEFVRHLTTEDVLHVEPALSPDSTLIAYASGTTQRLRIFVQRILDGTKWTLSADTNAFEQMPNWSPDGRQIVYLAHDGAYVAASSNGTPRLVAEGSEGDHNIRSASWAPHGDSLALVRNDRLYVQKLYESGARVVGTGEQLHACQWSPNGKWIACVSGNWFSYIPGALFGNRNNSVIVLFPANGGASIELTDREHRYDSPVWSSDSRQLYVVSNRDGTLGDVYAIPISSRGRASKPFSRIPTGLDLEGISVRGGQIAYSVRSNRATIWSVPIPAHGVGTLANSRQLTHGDQVSEVLRASRDGAWLVYDSDSIRDADLYRMPTTGGAVLRLTSDPRPEFGGELSPDNRELAYQILLNNERHVQVKQLESGTVTDVFKVSGDHGLPRWSPDGRSLAGWTHPPESGIIFVVHRNSDGTWQKEAWRFPNAMIPVWSPDGRSLAYMQINGSVWTIPADSGPSRRLYAPRPGTDDPKATYLAWREQADTLWFIANDAHGSCGIWALPVSNGPPRLRVQLDMTQGRQCGPTITMDAKRFFFTIGEQLSNIRLGKLKERRN